MTERRSFPAALTAFLSGLWQRLKSVNIKESVELAAKLAAPLAVVLGGWLAHSFQSSLTMTQLIASREEADTKIRAEMFRAITEKLIGARTPEPTPEQRAVFSELLALNFHEHFELKPLLQSVDESLRAQVDEEPDNVKKDILVNRGLELRSVARRVRERQMAMLVRPDYLTYADDTKWWWQPSIEALRFEHGDVRMLSLHFTGKLPTGATGAISATSAMPDPNRTACDLESTDLGQTVCANSPLFVNAPDGRSAIAMSVAKADWKRETFTLRIKRVKRFHQLTGAELVALEKQAIIDSPTCDYEYTKNETGDSSNSPGALEFDISWFDLPLTDNTQLWSGSRYSLFIDQVCGNNEKGGDKVVRFGLMWFPRDYFPPRERPTNYHEFRQKLNLSAAP